MEKSESFVSVAEYARLNNLTLGYVYSLVWGGRIPAEKVNGVWRIAAPAASGASVRGRVTAEPAHATA